MPLHQALTRDSRERLRTILPRHEQGGAFRGAGRRALHRRGGRRAWPPAARARRIWSRRSPTRSSTASRWSAITGQVPTAVIGSDAFQETPIVEVCRGITKHHYLVTDVNDVARVVKEAFVIATDRPPGTGADRRAQGRAAAAIVCARLRDAPLDLPGYNIQRPSRRPKARRSRSNKSAAAIKLAKRPVIYAGGGDHPFADASEELRELVAQRPASPSRRP